MSGMSWVRLWVREGRHRQSWHVPRGLMGWLAFLKGNLPSDGTSHLPTTSAQDSLPGLKYCYLAASPKGPLTPLAQTPGHLPSSSTQEPDSTPSRAREMLTNQTPQGSAFLPTVKILPPSYTRWRRDGHKQRDEALPWERQLRVGRPSTAFTGQSLPLPEISSKAETCPPSS